MKSNYGEYQKIWNKSTTIEKAYFVKEANLEHRITIFTDLDQAPNWSDIETQDQSKLREAIRKVRGG